MCRHLLASVAALSVVLSPGLSHSEENPASSLAGKWTYRSFHNNPTLVADDPNTAAEKALALIFAEAVFTFEIPTSTTLKGAIDWPGGGLDLQGAVKQDPVTGPP